MPVVSGRPSITFMFCTAWPEAPLVRLSSTEPMMARPAGIQTEAMPVPIESGEIEIRTTVTLTAALR